MTAGIVEVRPARAGGRSAATPGSASTSTLRPTASAVFGLTPGADAAVRRARDRLVELQRVAPERLVAERVEAEGLPALLELLARIVADGVVADPMTPLARLGVGGPVEHRPGDGAEDHGGHEQSGANGGTHDDLSRKRPPSPAPRRFGAASIK